jgi:ribosomal protein S18 acetylase RimI-like enzyme
MKTPRIDFVESPHDVDWPVLKAALKRDRFDNGRSAKELRASFHNSRHVCFAMLEGRVIGSGRLLSDGVCNAYLVDVWVSSRYRRRGIASRIIALLLNAVPGQHIYLQTNDPRLYSKLGFRPQPEGMSIVAGPWLGRSAG